MDDWSKNNQVFILINLLWPIIVTLHLHCSCSLLFEFKLGEVWRWCSLSKEIPTHGWVIYVFSLYLWNFILPTSLSIQITLMSLKNLSEWGLACQYWKKTLTQDHFFIYKLQLSLSLSLSSLPFLKTKKDFHMQNPLNS